MCAIDDKCLSLLGIVLPGCKPGAKIFLLKFLLKYSPNQLCDSRHKDLSKEFGVTDRVVREGLVLGLSSKILLHADVENLSRSGYKINPEWWAELKVSRRIVHREAILELLRPDVLIVAQSAQDRDLRDDEKRGSSRKYNLNQPQRLLVATFLYYASSCGVVRDLGKGLLCKLCGITGERLASQIKTLKAKEYLVDNLPGGTDSRLIWRVRSAYTINMLDSSPLSDILTEAKQILFGRSEWDLAMENLQVIIGYVVRGWVQDSSCLAKIRFDEPLSFEFCLKKRELLPSWDRSAVNLLKLYLSRHMAYLINTHWSELGNSEVQILEGIFEEIRGQIKSSKIVRDDEGSGGPDEVLLENLTHLLYRFLWYCSHGVWCELRNYFPGQCEHNRIIGSVDVLPHKASRGRSLGGVMDLKLIVAQERF